MSRAQIRLPPKLVPVFSGPAWVRGAYGGRASAKSRSFALMTAVKALMFAQADISGIILCCREYSESIRESSFAEIKQSILETPWLAPFFVVGKNFIHTRCGRVHYAFTGLRVNLNTVKGKSRVLLAWVDEAEDVSDLGWTVLIPTVRGDDNAELWVTWNPEVDGSATDQRFRKDTDPEYKIVQMNADDNPWLPKSMVRARRTDRRNMTDSNFAWVWEGAYRKNSEAQIFKDKYRVEYFEVGDDWDEPLHGLDWGFATDPTAAVRAYIHQNKLYISHDFSEVGLKLDDTAKEIKEAIPGIEAFEVRADSARPESIAHVKEDGSQSSPDGQPTRENLPHIVPAKKGKGSVEDGIAYIQSFDAVIIHPRCKATLSEFRLYSYKVNPRTKIVSNDIADAHNHIIDALRYALERERKAVKSGGILL